MVRHLLLAILTIFFTSSAEPYEGHSLATHEPYLPQKYDLGGALGTGWSTSSYVLIEIFGGFETTSCGFHCFDYIDAAFRTAAQNGETNYQGTVGWRFQKYFDNSSWGPYARPFIGLDHYLYSGQVKDMGFGGVALGTFYYLHPGADLRIEGGQAFGPQAWSYLSIGVVLKFRNI